MLNYLAILNSLLGHDAEQDQRLDDLEDSDQAQDQRLDDLEAVDADARLVDVEEQAADADTRLTTLETADAGHDAALDGLSAATQDVRVEAAMFSALAMCHADDPFPNLTTDVVRVADASTGEYACGSRPCFEVHLMYSYQAGAAGEETLVTDCRQGLDLSSNPDLVGAWACCTR